jgi:hypothetical protein
MWELMIVTIKQLACGGIVTKEVEKVTNGVDMSCAGTGEIDSVAEVLRRLASRAVVFPCFILLFSVADLDLICFFDGLVEIRSHAAEFAG